MRLLLIAFALVAVACSEPQSNLHPTIADDDQSKFATLSGGIYLRFAQGEHVNWYEMRNGRIQAAQPHRRARREATASVEPFGATALASTPPGSRYLGAFDFAPQGDFAVAGFVGVRDTSSPREVAVVDVRNRNVAAVVTGPDGARVDALSWSPDGRHIALLFKISTPVRGQLFASHSGHPPSVDNYWLVIVDTTGQVLARSEILSGYPASTAEIIWDQ